MTPEQVLDVLRDGRYHSGSDVAELLGGTRARVWQCIQQLQGWGIDIWRVRGKGYRLSPEVELVDRDRLLNNLTGKAKQLLKVADFALDMPSTNAHLLSAPVVSNGYQLMFAEHQSAGKGRHGKTWLSPPAKNLSFSIAKQVDSLSSLQALSLTVGQSVAAVLARLGLPVQLKWPNDVYLDGQKVCGILVELKTNEDRSAKVVIGIGINVNASFASEEINQYSTHINKWLAEPISRTTFLSELLNQVIDDIEVHLAGYRKDLLLSWQQYDWLRGQQVNVIKGGEVTQQGLAVGVDDDGSLLVKPDVGEVVSIAHGEVSVRPQ